MRQVSDIERQMTGRDMDEDFGSRFEIAKVTELLGGQQVLRREPRDSLQAHELLSRGLPSKALTHLVKNLIVLNWDDSFARAIGMSQRTYQRHASAGTKLLSQEQSGRTWKLAEILAKTTDVFGSREEAEQWLERPAMGLNQRRPIDLLATPAGVEMVETFLDRLDYGVYV
jgi:putative toxin-antitoxin system antitoxin component (TIGR02293 family)